MTFMFDFGLQESEGQTGQSHKGSCTHGWGSSTSGRSINCSTRYTARNTTRHLCSASRPSSHCLDRSSSDCVGSIPTGKGICSATDRGLENTIDIAEIASGRVYRGRLCVVGGIVAVKVKAIVGAAEISTCETRSTLLQAIVACGVLLDVDLSDEVKSDGSGVLIGTSIIHPVESVSQIGNNRYVKKIINSRSSYNAIVAAVAAGSWKVLSRIIIICYAILVLNFLHAARPTGRGFFEIIDHIVEIAAAYFSGIGRWREERQRQSCLVGA